MKKALIGLILLLSISGYAQNFNASQYSKTQVIESGINMTTYNTNGLGLNSDFAVGAGVHFFASVFEVVDGVFWLGLAFDSFNSQSLTDEIKYSTSYLGISFKHHWPAASALQINFNFGIQTLIAGNLSSATVLKSLVDNKDFRGLLLTPGIGLDYTVSKTRSSWITIGYNFSYGFNPLNRSDISTLYLTHNIGVTLRY